MATTRTKAEIKRNNEAWDFAVGIVQTEGIEPCDFTLELIEKHKRGEISNEEMTKLIAEKYIHEYQNQVPKKAAGIAI